MYRYACTLVTVVGFVCYCSETLSSVVCSLCVFMPLDDLSSYSFPYNIIREVDSFLCKVIMFIPLTLILLTNVVCRFAAALINRKLDCWVMNAVPVTEPNTLPVIYDRGLLGVAHDWYAFVYFGLRKFYFYFRLDSKNLLVTPCF
jgi:hypothetical protein